MPRTARIVIPDIPYHITSRGNHGQDVFFTTDDRTRFLKWLSEYSVIHELDILAYCLMSNHIHIVAIPHTINSLARTLHVIKLRHTQSVNFAKDLDGILWQGRYFATALDDLHLWVCIRYVEQNPVRAGIVRHAWEYMWSSAACHCGLRDDPVLVSRGMFSSELEDWKDELIAVPDAVIVERIRKRTHTGVPCGNDKFVEKISGLINRELKARDRGRPRKIQY
jgi:putative transposase